MTFENNSGTVHEELSGPETVEMTRDIYSLVANHTAEIVRTLNPEISEESKIKLSRLDLKSTGGMREGCDLMFGKVYYKTDKNGVAPKKEMFFIKRFPEEQRPEYIPDLTLEKAFYDLMKDSHVVPGAYKIGGIDNSILLESMGDRTLDDKLYRNNLSEKEKDRIVKESIRVLAIFHIYARQKSSQLLMNLNKHKRLVNWLRSAGIKDLKKSSQRYFGGNIGERKDVLHNYAPIIRVYTEKNGQQLIHGDAGAQNFIGPPRSEWDASNIKLADLAGLRFGHSIFDLAQLLTSPGMKYDPEKWNEYREFYRDISIAPGERSKENDIKLATRDYASKIHEPSKRLITFRTFREEDSENFRAWVERRPSLNGCELELGDYVKDALSYILDHPKETNFSKDELKKLEKHGRYLQEKGIIT